MNGLVWAGIGFALAGIAIVAWSVFQYGETENSVYLLCAVAGFVTSFMGGRIAGSSWGL